MKNLLLISSLISALLISACNKDNPVIPETSGSFSKVLSFDTAGYTFEMYSMSGNSLFIGYNDIGFKIYNNGIEKTSGFVKFTPVMYHFTSTHSTPVSSNFLYNTEKKLFTGYVSYIMYSDSGSVWTGTFNYNNELTVSNKPYTVYPRNGIQMQYWLNTQTSNYYLLTLIEPLEPKTGLNEYKLILHRTTNDFDFYEVDSAEFYIRPWMPSHGHGSSNNVNPIFKGNGKYEGIVNFTMPGQWYVYDSIKVNNNFITPTPSSYFVFDVR